jgi:hypothetical protein
MAEVEMLMVANHVEARDGLLFMSGGGWADLWRGNFTPGAPPVNHFGIALSIRIPWTETDRPHHWVMTLAHEDGDEVFRGEGEVGAGRPQGVPEGSDQSAVLAVNIDMQFPHAGGYRLTTELAGEEWGTSFRVHDEPTPTPGA